MSRLPLSVIGGYLGAGKTTLINRLLTGDHGLRLMVLVNDFGAINIDAAFLQVQGEDMIELTNGCVCCSLVGSLFQAVGDILDRPQRPDHLIIEASGISDPAKIANLALAEPDLVYAGILTVVDGLNFADQMADDLIAGQVARQVQVADFLAVSKVPAMSDAVATWLSSLSPRKPFLTQAADLTQHLLVSRFEAVPERDGVADHPDYAQWTCVDPGEMTEDMLRRKLVRRPVSVLRMKGFVPDPDGHDWAVQVVGGQYEIQRQPQTARRGLVAIGLQGGSFAQDMQTWWPA